MKFTVDYIGRLTSKMYRKNKGHNSLLYKEMYIEFPLIKEPVGMDILAQLEKKLNAARPKYVHWVYFYLEDELNKL